MVALNARYVHTNLAIRYLRETLKAEGQEDWSIGTREFSINEHLENIAAEIYEEKPDIIGFSCYIWNITQILALTNHLRLVLPQTYIIVGGPEVSYDADSLLTRNPQLNAVIIGDGDHSLPSLVNALSSGSLPLEVRGLVWRQEDLITINQTTSILQDINSLPNPYSEEEVLDGRLAYVETTRGCPYSCKFCISSTFQGVRFLEPERFRHILRKLFQYGASTIKFVDRTFNANKKHAFTILSIFKEEAERYSALNPDKNLRAHCEMAGELLDQEWLQFLREFPDGLIQLEIGVQSTHQPTLEAINRPQSFVSWKEKVHYLQHICNIPIHLDLIAGLPLEGWGEFSRSFDEVYEVRPDNLQLGFLKVLKGSEIWSKSEELRLVYSSIPPYSVLKTDVLSHDEILALKRIEDILGKYYNSGKFKYILEYVLSTYESAFTFYHSFSEYWHSQSWFRREWARKDLFGNLWEYLNLLTEKVPGQNNSSSACELRNELISIWKEALRFDYCMNGRPGQIPEFFLSDYSREKGVYTDKEIEIVEKIRKDAIWQKLIPESRLMDRRQWVRATAVERFDFDVPKYSSKESQLPNKQEVWYLFYYTGDRVQSFIYPEQRI